MVRRRKQSKSLQGRMAEDIARAKAERERYRTLLEGKDTPFWKEVQARVDARAEEVERKLDDWVQMPEKELSAVLERRKIYRFFRDMVNEADVAIEILEKRIVSLQDAVKDKAAE